MILEGIVTTVSAEGRLNVAPMGPMIAEGCERIESLVLRPYQTATTFRNLKETRQGVFHVTDDVMVFAEGIVGSANPPTVAAERVAGRRLEECCRYYEFVVKEIDESSERSRIEATVIHSGRVRDFVGFCRAKYAVVEAAILASRIGILAAEEIQAELAKLDVLVDKTGGRREREAFDLLRNYVIVRTGN